MIITKIVIKDFGRHKLIDNSINSPVVGLLGKNGCGKSTILAAIKFAFTGVLGKKDEKAETFVREFGEVGGARNGSVRINFIKDGKEGSIFRQVGVSPKRELIWDGGKPITSAKEVEARLSDIFSANKEAVSTVVFIEQGELDKLLFGTSSERADLFLKMMLLDFLPKRADMIAKKIETLSVGITDYSAIQDGLRTQREQAEAAVSSLRGQLKSLPDYSDKIRALEQWLTRAENLNKLSDHRRDLEVFLNDKGAAMHSEVGRLNQALDTSTWVKSMEPCQEGIFRPASFEAKRDHILKYRTETKQHLAELELGKSYLYQYDKAKFDVEESSTQLELAELVQFSRQAKFSGMPSEDSILLGINRATERARYETEKVALKQQYDALEREKNNFPIKAPWTVEDFKTADAELQTLTEAAGFTKMQVELFKKVAALDTEHKHTKVGCPLCGYTQPLNISADMISFTEKRWVEEETRRSMQQQKVARMRVDNEIYTTKSTDFKTRGDALEASRKRVETLLADIEPPNQTIEEMQAKLAEVREMAIKCREADTAVVNAHDELDTNKAILGRFTNDMHLKIDTYKMCIHRYAPADPIDKFKKDLVIVEEAIAATETLFSIVINLDKSLSDKRLELQTVKSMHGKLIVELEDSYKTLWVIVESDGTLDNKCEIGHDSLERFKSVQSERDQLIGRLQQAEKVADDIRIEQAKVEQRVENDQKIRSLVENLRQLKETLSRGGLPMTVMNHQFKQLVELVQEHLANLGATFSVTADPDRPISFCFQRTDDDSDYTMTQEKLSGGQRVRLTVAMLMAVQQLIIPEVGFLVLDEPSASLDDEGVESFRELFQTMSARMSSVGSQVIVCTHHQLLRSAFSRMIEIKT